MTPVHSLATSTPIQKTLAKRLWPQPIETAAFKELGGFTNTPEDPFSPLPPPHTNPPYFIPGLHPTQEHLKAKISGFLWPENKVPTPNTGQHVQHPTANAFQTEVGEVTPESLTAQVDAPAHKDELEKIPKLPTTGTHSNITPPEQDQTAKQQTSKINIPPIVATPAPLLRNKYTDTMLMPPAAGYSLTVEEIATDSGAAFVTTLDTLTDRVIERQHCTTYKSLIKVTVHTPFYMVHGVVPIFPSNIMLATSLVPNITKPLTTSERPTICAHQLQNCDKDLAVSCNNISKSRVRQAERTHERALCNSDSKPQAPVLMCPTELDRCSLKTQTCGLSPGAIPRVLPACNPGHVTNRVQRPHSNIFRQRPSRGGWRRRMCRGGVGAWLDIENKKQRTLRRRKWTQRRKRKQRTRMRTRKISTPKKSLTRDGQYFDPPAGVRVTLPLCSKPSVLLHLPSDHNATPRTHRDSASHASEP